MDMRETNLRMEDIIFRPNSEPEKFGHTEDPNRYYTCLGEQEYLDEDGYSRVSEDADNIYAKSVNKNGTTNFFVKCNRYGKLYNPTGMYTEGQHKRFNKMIGANEFTFKKVNLRIFELYTSFLKTKNIAWLNNAERELT